LATAADSFLAQFDPRLGFYGPGSVGWKVSRELIVLLTCGARALLLQVAHPLVAAGVVEHSRYKTDPLGRLRHTLEASYAFTFGDLEHACRLVQAVNRRHARVRGRLPEPVGAHAAQQAYQAMDPELLLWVYATLVDSTILGYERFVGPLTPAERAVGYAEARRAGPAWGIPPDVFPDTLEELRAWMQALIERGEVAVGEQGREIAATIMGPPVWWLPRPAMAPLALVTVWLLPPVLRQQFGYRWGPRRERAMRALAALSRAGVPRLPRLLRDHPAARAAERRVRAGRAR
jgi:uncharacterized protein (DUF2236 family)